MKNKHSAEFSETLLLDDYWKDAAESLELKSSSTYMFRRKVGRIPGLLLYSVLPNCKYRAMTPVEALNKDCKGEVTMKKSSSQSDGGKCTFQRQCNQRVQVWWRQQQWSCNISGIVRRRLQTKWIRFIILLPEVHTSEQNFTWSTMIK